MVDLLSSPILVTIILGAVGLAIPAIDAARREKGRDRNKLYSAIAFGALVVAIAIIVFRVLTGEVLPAVAFSQEVVVDDLFGSFFAIALLIVSIMVTASSWNYYKGRLNPGAYYSLILLSSIGMVIIAYSTDLVMLLVAWELMSLPTYALAGFSKRDPISNEAAIKYFMFGALSSAIIVLAIGLVYGITGTTNIGDSISALANLDASLTPIGLLAVALFIAGFGAAIRVIVLGMFALNLDWTLTLAIIAVFTMTLGNLAALMQRSVPRILAYSSIAQAGYIMIGIALAPYSDQALSGSLFHIMNHAVMKSAGFIAVAAVATALAGYSLEKYRGLGRRMPITAIAFSISLLALAGVPPLNGFWSKLVLFGAGINSGPIVEWGPWLAIAGVLNSALSLGYYAWIMRKMYMEDAPDMRRVKEPRAIVAVLIFAMVFMVAFGIWYTPLLDFASNAVPDLTSNITQASTVAGGGEGVIASGGGRGS